MPALDLPLYDHRINGERAIMGELRTAMRGLKDIKVDLHHVIEKGDRGFAEGVFTAEHVGIPPHVDGTPVRLDFKFVAVATLAAGKIVHWTEHFDVKPLKPPRAHASLSDHPPLALLGRHGRGRRLGVHGLQPHLLPADLPPLAKRGIHRAHRTRDPLGCRLRAARPSCAARMR